MWRPNDWEEFCEKYCPDMDRYDPDPMVADKAFEAGADAILEALKKYNSLGHGVTYGMGFGWEVFIPDGRRDGNN